MRSPMFALATSLLALNPLAAQAAEHELSLVLGIIETTDDAATLYTRDETAGARGARLGVRVHDRVAVVADYDHFGRGAVLDSEDSLAIAWTGNRYALGARADVAVTSWFRPYFLAEGALTHARLRVDEDRNSRVNDGQYAWAGIAPQGIAALGLDLGTPRDEYSGLGVGGWFEVGYGLGAPVSFEGLGAIDTGGWQVRGGIGIRR